MSNDALVNLLSWCKQERTNLRGQLDAMLTGKFSTHSNDGMGWRDTTQDNIKRVQHNIAELERLIMEYESERA